MTIIIKQSLCGYEVQYLISSNVYPGRSWIIVTQSIQYKSRPMFTQTIDMFDLYKCKETKLCFDIYQD